MKRIIKIIILSRKVKYKQFFHYGFNILVTSKNSKNRTVIASEAKQSLVFEKMKKNLQNQTVNIIPVESEKLRNKRIHDLILPFQ